MHSSFHVTFQIFIPEILLSPITLLLKLCSSLLPHGKSQHVPNADLGLHRCRIPAGPEHRAAASRLQVVPAAAEKELLWGSVVVSYKCVE